MNQPDPQQEKKDGPQPDQSHDPTTEKVHGPTQPATVPLLPASM